MSKIPEIFQGSFPGRGRSLAVAVSGGVDSLCALLLAAKAGFDVIAVHALFCHTEDSEQDILQGLADNCRKLGIPLHTADMQHEFRANVMTPFAESYLQGMTPNPCARCNRSMKFGLLMDYTTGLGADMLLTGHYAALSRSQSPATEAAPLLSRAADSKKDQSYFLSLVKRSRLSRVFFPLFQQTKEETIRIVTEAGLTVPAEKESQDICFIPGGGEDYRQFLQTLWEERGKTFPGDGPVILRSRGCEDICIGTHHGLWRYTEGQRQGLGIPWKEPIYVTGKDVSANILFTGTKQDALMHGVTASEVNLMVPVETLPRRALVRLRYRQNPAPATVTAAGEEQGYSLRIELDTPATLSAPGQIACVYDELGRILAGGVITSVF